jgi:hypothetical protein
MKHGMVSCTALSTPVAPVSIGSPFTFVNVSTVPKGTKVFVVSLLVVSTNGAVMQL